MHEVLLGKTRKADKLVPYLILAMVLLFTLFPLYWMIVTSFKTPLEFVARDIAWIPTPITLEHYGKVVEEGFMRFFQNTIIIAVFSTILAVTAGALAAYSLTRFRFRANFDKLFLLWAIIVRIIPPIVFLTPLFITFRELGLDDVKLRLILSYQVYVLPLCIWLLLGFFRDLPIEFEEAAQVDGASRIYTLRTVVFPLIAPGLVAAAIFSIITTWNEFIYALIFARVSADFTIPVGIATLIGEYEVLWGALSAAGFLSSLPILIFTVYVQKHLLRSFAKRVF
ncbi:carbohydrate ABC transporter permease [Dehalococcoidia bacterium]|nr:carbohydrate ABC transporter permease [Dehalococcoidia bacterium]MCL0087749.1 carbohydrate ABC transporter permease [Dehalococcoidia bacterium]MCL0093981.1 carbohydrate ABC transporter permease [Dehalococcoidia bacterium]